MTDKVGQESSASLPADGAAPDWSPKSFSEFVGQTQAVRRLKPLIDLSKERGTALPHILIIGTEGSGKRTLAKVLANEMGAAIVSTVGPSLERGADLMGILTNLSERDVFYIDEIHLLPRTVEELLLSAMEEFSVNFVVGQGLNAQTRRIPLRPFTLIGAAAREADIPVKLRALFPVNVVFQLYSEPELGLFAQALARARGFALAPDGAEMVARFSKGSFRAVRSALQLAAQPGAAEISKAHVSQALAILGDHAADGAPIVPADLMKLSGTEFEVCVTGLLQQMGFRTELTRATGDGGIDIVAFLDKPIIGGRYLVQCKRFSDNTPVGAPEL